MVESEGKSYSGSESEASDSESEELALASEEGAESPYFSADIMASSESTDMVRCVWYVWCGASFSHHKSGGQSGKFSKVGQKI